MKLLGRVLVLGVVPIVHLARAQVTRGGGRPSGIRAGITRFAEEGILEAGASQVHAIAHGDEQVGESLIEQLQANGGTIVREVEVGELLCDSLKDAPDSTLLRFAISSSETVIAERSSYSTVNGSVLADGKERKVWMGNVVDPKPLYPRTVSMTWVDPCEMESFLLKVVSTNTDGTTAITKSVPCEAGSSTEFCIVELSVEEEMTGPIPVDEEDVLRRLNTKESINATALPSRDGDAATTSSERRLQGTTRIDLMVLYNEDAWSPAGYGHTEPVLLTMMAELLQGTNQALVNSKIDMIFNPVHVGRLPYKTETRNCFAELKPFRLNSDVVALRNLHRADLTMLVGWFNCGVTYGSPSQAFGFSLMPVHLMSFGLGTHELGHNLGCSHNRPETMEDSDPKYNFGYVQCAADPPFRTQMAYSNGKCQTGRINYFSNPDVKYNGHVTGDSMNNCAQQIRDTMEKVSHYRDPCVQPGNTCAVDYECCGGSCLQGICVDDCFNRNSLGYRCTYEGSTTLKLHFCAMTDSDARKSLRSCFTAFGLTNIKLLRLDNNELSTLRAGVFDGLGSLTRLKLNHNQLTVLPRELFDGLGSLTRLDLNNNNLITLPDGATLGDGLLGGLRSLEVLDLANNDLTVLPLRMLHGLKALTTMNLKGNQLTCLPMISSRVTKLMVDGSVKGEYCVDVNGCLRPGDSDYRCNRGGSTLNLKSCGITDSDASRGWLQSCFNIFGPTNVQLLNLANNKLSTLPAGVFDELGSLTMLNLPNNKLSTLPAGVFDELGSLTRLVLTANKLTILPKGLFDGLGSLTRLDLNDNALKGKGQGVPNPIFDGLRSLTILDLHDNELVALGVGVFDSLVSLIVLNLKGNQLPCLPTVPRSVTKLLVDGSVKGDYCDLGRTCDNGIVGVQGRIGDGREACCPLTCLNDDGEPQCGNGGCQNRPGGIYNCCVANIFGAREDCNDTGEAPCFIST